MQQQVPPIPGLGAPIPPTDPARAALYKHPRPGMNVASIPAGYKLVPDSDPAPKAPPRRNPAQNYSAPDGGPPVRGLAAYMDVGPGFDVEGTHYGFRRLGLRDANTIYKITEDIVSWGLHNGVLKFGSFIKILRDGKPKTEEKDAGEAWLLAMIAPFLGVRVVDEDLFELLESIILEEDQPLQAGDLSNPEKFPMGVIPIIVSAISKHPDLGSFFGSCKKEAESPIIQSIMAYLGMRANNLLDSMTPTPKESPDSTDGSE